MKQFSFLFLFINALFFGQANVSYDASFGNNGRLLTNNESNGLKPTYFLRWPAKTIQNIDNKLIAIIGSKKICRYNLNGTLDMSFGVAGIVSVTSSDNSYEITDLANLSDGSILVTLDSGFRSYIKKLKANGVLDTTFGNDGSLELITNTFQNRFEQIKVLNDDSVLVAGRTRPDQTSSFLIGIIKIDKNGNFDTSFSLDGKITLGATQKNYSKLLGLETDSSNNIYVGYQSNVDGSTLNYANVQKITPNGNIVSNFGTNGIASQFVNGECYHMNIFPNGKILIAASYKSIGTNDVYLISFTSAGLLDTSVGTGIFRYDIDNNSDDLIQKIVIIDNNTFYLTGYITTGGISYGLVLKLKSNFTFDSNFNFSGIFTTYYSANRDSTNSSLLIQKDKKLLLSGVGSSATSNTTSYFGFIRLIDTKLLATNESIKVNSISIYPNPASEFINLQYDKSLTDQAYEILDMTGKSVLRSKVSGKTINISSLTTGNYILKIDSESYKFIKK